MLASLALLQIALTAPLAGPSGPLAGALAQADTAAPAPAPAQPGDALPPSGAAPAPEAPPPAAAPDAPPAAPAEPVTPPPTTTTPTPAPPPAAPARPRFPSLQGAEALGGTSAFGAWAGWSSLGAAWAMGVAASDDVGAFLDHDWAKSEAKLGGLWRHPVAVAGGFDVAFRLTAALYVNLGSTYVYSQNHSERGFEVAPALVVSQRAAGGLFSAAAEGPLTVTTKYDTGILFSPRFVVSYETPLYPEMTVGARIGAGYRAGAGDAPLRTGRGELQFLVLATYQLL